MSSEVFTFLVGGKAGEGVKKAGSVAANLFSGMGRHVFQYDDYQSLIRGGHNYSIVSTSTSPVLSQYMKAQLVVNLDKKSCDMHKSHLTKDGILVHNSDSCECQGLGVPFTSLAKDYPNPDLMLGVGAVAVLAAALGMEDKEMKSLVNEQYPRNVQQNIQYASSIFDIASKELKSKFELEPREKTRPIITGNQAIAMGAVCGGLDTYFAYPMTPASSILHTLAEWADELGIVVLHPESEISVVNMAIGAAFTGARTMVGTSGGGMALMEEGFSLAGMSEAPLLCVLSSRPGPATGVPTYTSQGDLRFALGQGHGEFPRIAASPGTMEEAFVLAAEMLDLVWKFQTPGILLTEKHLSESAMTVDLDMNGMPWAKPITWNGKGQYRRYEQTKSGISPLHFPPSKELVKWSSYEHDELGITTERPEKIAAMHEKRKRKEEALLEHVKGMRTVNRFGKGPEILTYGSTTMSVLEALNAGCIEASVVQPIYLEPFPTWELEGLDEYIVVEQSCIGQFAQLVQEKTGKKAKAVLKRYDGRPFDPAELAVQIKEVL